MLMSYSMLWVYIHTKAFVSKKGVDYMRKKFAMLLMVLLVMAVSACQGAGEETAGQNADGKSAYELYVKASEELEKADSQLLNYSSNIKMNTEGEDMEMVMNGTIAQIIRSETDIDMKMEMATSMLDQETQMLAYYKEGMYYQDLAGQKVKMPMSLDDMEGQMQTAIAFPETAIKSQSVKETEAGTELAFSLEAEAVQDIIQSRLGSLTETLGSDGSMEFGDFDIEVTLDDADAIQTMKMVFSAVITAQGQAVDCLAETTMDIEQIGGVTIDFPADLDSYVEIEAP